MQVSTTKTYFNGLLTQKQLLIVIVAVVLGVLVLTLVKKILKMILMAGIICVALVSLNINAPLHLRDVSSVLSGQNRVEITQLVKKSNNIKLVSSSGGIDIQIKLNGKWVSVDDIKSFVKTDNGAYSIAVNGNNFDVTDVSIKRLLDLLQK